jgi:hypothetical protein
MGVVHASERVLVWAHMMRRNGRRADAYLSCKALLQKARSLQIDVPGK